MMDRRQKWITLSICVFLWYYASALSATSSQSYVKKVKELSISTSSVGRVLLAMVIVTFLQMVSGVLVGLALGMSILFSTKDENARNSIWSRTYQRFRSSMSSSGGCSTAKILIATLGFPALHAAGSLFTNFGYACSSASFVQMIKLTEPIQTVLLDILLRKIYKVPRPAIKVSISCFLLGAFLVFMSRNSTTASSTATASRNTSSFWAVITVLLSGFFLSSRNVMKKIIHWKEGENSSSSGKATKVHSETTSVTNKVLEGVEDFIHLSLGAALVLLPVVILLLLMLMLGALSWSQDDTSSISTRINQPIQLHNLFLLSSSPYLSMIVTHSVYNVASLSVLSFVAAPIHSLLNSGKRLSSTLFAMVWFGENITGSMVSGFILIFAGAAPFSKETQRLMFLFFSLGISGLVHNSMQVSEFYAVAPNLRVRNSTSNFLNSWLSPITTMRKELKRSDCKVQFIANDMRICHVSSKFGLELGPAAILKLLENEFQCSIDEIPIHSVSNMGRDPNIRCLFSVGSTLHMLRSGDFVWGAGSIPSQLKWEQTNIPQNVTFFSVRGPQTAALVEEKFNLSQGALAFGEPAFLISSLYNLSTRYQQRRGSQHVKVKAPPGRLEQNATEHDSEMQRFCFVFRPQDSSFVRQLPLSQANVIATNQTWRTVLDFIKTCQYVASSSLYGIVVADSLRIPSLWFQFPYGNASVANETFKIHDYYQAIGRPNNKQPIMNSSLITDVNNYNSIFSEGRRDEIIQQSLASFPYHLFTTTTTVKSNRTLVIIMGTLRGGEASWSSMYKHLLEPNSADLALLIPKNTPRSSSLFNRSKFVWEHDEYADWGVAIEKYINGSKNTKWRQMVIPRNCLATNLISAKKTGLFGGVKEHSKCKCLEVKLGKPPLKNHSCYKEREGSGAIIFVLRVLLQQNIRRLSLHEKYDRFVVTRSDHYYGCSHNLDDLDNRYMWIPGGEDYLGITDRHLVCNSSHILKALNILPPVVLNPQKYWNVVGHINPERLIKHRWVEEELWDVVRRFPRNMFTCATRNDTSRWALPNFSGSTIPEGVYLKYVEEYKKTKATCNGTKNYFTGDICKICNSFL